MNQREYYSIFRSEPEVLTVHDVARLLRIGKNKAYSLVKSGGLKSIRIGGKTIIPKVNLIEFLVGRDSSCVRIETSEEVSQIISDNLWTSEKSCGIVGDTNGRTGSEAKERIAI